MLRAIHRAGATSGQGDGLRVADFAGAIALLVFGLAALVVASLSPSGRNGQYLVIAPPWFTDGETIALIQRASGRLAETRDGIGMIAQSNRPGFVSDLYRAGAWLVIDPMRVAGCGGSADIPGGARR